MIMKNIAKLICTIMLFLFAGLYAHAQNNKEVKPQVAELPAISSEKMATDLSTGADRKGSENSNVSPDKSGTAPESVKPVLPQTDIITKEKVRSTEINPKQVQPAAKPVADAPKAAEQKPLIIQQEINQ